MFNNCSSTYVKVVFNVNGERKKSFTRKIYGEISQYEIDNEVQFYNTIHQFYQIIFLSYDID